MFIKCDIVNQCSRLENIDPVDEIYHLASLASPPKYKKYPMETLDVNVIGTRNMLELAVKWKCKFLLTSTSEVYGDPLQHPQRESYYGNVNTVGERSCYDESKRCAETYVYECRRKYKGDFKICRIFNTYGPHMDLDDGRIITHIIQSIVYNRPVQVYGDGTQTRSFCYIDDMIDGLMSLMESVELGPINLGNPNTEVSLNSLIELFESEIQLKIQNVNLERTENDPLIRKPDISLAREKLGFEPKVDLNTGIHNTLMHFILTNPDLFVI
jgi:UDP-glucuronate decarboxylase